VITAVVVVVAVSAVIVSGRGPSTTGAFVTAGAVIGAETGSSWVMVIILIFPSIVLKNGCGGGC